MSKKTKILRLCFFIYFLISILFILFLLFTRPIKWDELDKNTVPLSDCSSSYCLLIDFELTDIDEEYAVGDSFSYSFRLKNVGNGTISYNLIVTSKPEYLLSPEPEKKYSVTLEEGESKSFYPKLGERIQIYDLNEEGSYTIFITPEKYTHFIKYPSYTKVAHNRFGFSFDVVSRWEKKWAQRIEILTIILIFLAIITTIFAIITTIITFFIFKKRGSI